MKRDTIFIEEKINELIQINKLSIDEWTQELTKLKQGENSYKRPVEEIIKSAWKWHQSHPYGYNG